MDADFISYAFEAPALRGLIASAWGQAYGGEMAELPGIIAPDAHVEMVFQVGAPCRAISGGAEAQTPGAMIYGLRHGALRLRATGANRMVAVRMAPAMASVALRSNLRELWDRPAPLAELIGAEADLLLERLAAATLREAGSTLEAWLIGRLADWDADDLRQMRVQAALARGFEGPSVSALAETLGYTVRTLRRRCEAYAGLSPKQLVMSGRMLRACDLLRASETPLAEIALHLGFSDQSAFTNTFRHYHGMTPGALRAAPLVHYQSPP